MSVHRIASRYAKSLIDLAKETNKLERVKEDVDAFDKALQSRDFYLLLKSPIIKADKKASIMKAIFEGKFDEVMMAFVNLLVQKGREPYLPEITKEFQAQYKKMNHITTLKIITAKKLDAAAIDAIKAQFANSNETDDNVEVITEIDSSLIGGFVVQFGDKLYDASVKHKLATMKKEFAGNVYTSQVVTR